VHSDLAVQTQHCYLLLSKRYSAAHQYSRLFSRTTATWENFSSNSFGSREGESFSSLLSFLSHSLQSKYILKSSSAYLFHKDLGLALLP